MDDCGSQGVGRARIQRTENFGGWRDFLKVTDFKTFFHHYRTRKSVEAYPGSLQV